MDTVDPTPAPTYSGLNGILPEGMGQTSIRETDIKPLTSIRDTDVNPLISIRNGGGGDYSLAFVS